MPRFAPMQMTSFSSSIYYLMFQVHLQDGVLTSPRSPRIVFPPPREIGFLRSSLVWGHFPSYYSYSASIRVLPGRRKGRQIWCASDGTPCPQCVIFSTRPFILLSSSVGRSVEQLFLASSNIVHESRKSAFLGKRRGSVCQLDFLFEMTLSARVSYFGFLSVLPTTTTSVVPLALSSE